MTRVKAPVRLASPRQLLAAVPVLCGFQPASSFVIVGCAGREVRVALRYDLPDPPDAGTTADLVGTAAATLAGNGVDRACGVGYGPGVLVTPVVDALREHLPQAGITVAEMLRVEVGRYWSYLCTDPGCCPAEGVPFDPEHRPAGLDAQPVLASREELAASIAPVTGDEAESMYRAAQAASRRARRLAVGGDIGPVRAAGLEAVAEAISRYRDGGPPLSHGEAAWLARSLGSTRIRDDAWSRMDPEHRAAHLRLWTDLTRLARPGDVAPAASLLAFTAWQSGDGALANIALDRAQADHPDYGMADLIRTAVNNGAPPSLARLPMSPEDVAAAYAARGE
jgi:hypothetical protein